MSSLPRIDEVEKLLQEKHEGGDITKGLNTDLINELKQLKLLEKLIRSRITKIAMEKIREGYESNDGSAGREEHETTAEVTKEISHEWFENQVNRFYLEHRENFERVSFQMFMTTSKGIAVEAHQRLAEGEESWKTINERWGRDSEKENEGKYIQVKPDKMNRVLYAELQRLKKGEISEPLRTGGRFIAIIKLLDWDKAELNEELRAKLEHQLFNEWVNEQTNEIIRQIT